MRIDWAPARNNYGRRLAKSWRLALPLLLADHQLVVVGFRGDEFSRLAAAAAAAATIMMMIGADRFSRRVVGSSSICGAQVGYGLRRAALSGNEAAD